MKRHFRLFALYFAQYAKVRLAYKADFFIAFFSSMAATVLGFGFVWVLFSKIPRTVAAMEEKKAMKKSALYANRTLAYWAKYSRNSLKCLHLVGPSDPCSPCN